ncbi:MAG TPA: hypothetical protein VFM48_10685 [Aquabacterium sp.]|nr:hypothetical protein [Aquabacterium sp.]
MSLKKTDLAKNLGLKITQQMKKAGPPGRFASASTALPDRREQRKLDQAAGLVPFAVKLHDDLVKQLRDLAQHEGGNLNALTERLIRAGLASSATAPTSKPDLDKKAPAKKVAAKKTAAEKSGEPAPKVPAKNAAAKVAKKAAAEKTSAKKAAKKTTP